MKIKLLLLSAIIALATTSAASADSSHRYKDQRNQTFGHVEHHDKRAVDRHNNRLFSFSLIVPGPSYYMPHRYDNRHDYRNDYRYRNDYKHHNKHHNRHSNHHDRNNVHGFRGTR